jgi:hypothetical protein
LEVESVPFGPNFPQLHIGEPSNGFTPGPRSASLLLLSSKVVGALDNKKMKTTTTTMAPPNPQIFVHKTKMQNLRNFFHCSHILLLLLLLLFLLLLVATIK